MPEYFSQSLDLWLDVSSKERFPCRLLRDAYSQQDGGAPLFVQGTSALIRLHLVRPARVAGQRASDLRNPGAIVLCLKTDPITTLAPLAQVAAFLLRPSADGGEHYEATFDLNTQPISDLFPPPAALGAPPAPARNVILEIELQNPDNSAREKFQRRVTLVPQVYLGTEAVPSPVDQGYPPAASLLTRNEADALIDAKVTEQLPSLLANAVQAAVATAAARIPRITSASAATLPSGGEATAELSAPDSANPQNLALALGIPRGQDASIVGVPPGLLLLTATLPAGAREWTFSFPAAYAAPPFVFPAIRRPAGAPDAVFVSDVSALSETAATITLSAPTPSAGYTLTLQVFAAQ